MAWDMLKYEAEAWEQGFAAVAGVDEVGRGPLAGPVVACAFVVPRGSRMPAVDDSKKIAASRRRVLAEELRRLPGARIGLGLVAPGLIDRMNILKATMLAMRQALLEIGGGVDFALVDGRPVSGLPVPSRAIVKGDGLSCSIAAASIIAKVHRDRLMCDYDAEFPGYGFARHKGYGTREHLDALGKLGPCPIHRRSFAPVAGIINGGWFQPELDF